MRTIQRAWFWNTYGSTLLKLWFAAVLALRFLFPFFYNPTNYIRSDMLRHVQNGYRMLHPNFINAMDPKAYQVWVWLLWFFPKEQARTLDALATGLLCASFMWFWYKALREMTSRNFSLIAASLLGLHMAFLSVYSLFLNETLLLTAVALFSWLLLRAVRKRTLLAYTAASCAAMLCIFTKQTAIPLALIGLGYALFYQPKRLRALLVTAGLFIICVIPAGMQSMQVVHFFSPFGLTQVQTISRKSDSKQFSIHLHNQEHYIGTYGTWRPESFYANPLDPFGTYFTKRTKMLYIVDIDISQGKAAWDKALADVESKHSFGDIITEYEENFIYLFFSYDDIWPHAEMFPYPTYLLVINFWLRWLWAPCLLLVLCYGPFARLTPAKTWVLLVAFAMTWVFLLQDVGIVEGRYRKIIGPFLLLAAAFMIESLVTRAKEGEIRISLKEFIRSIYVQPLVHQFLGPIFPAGTQA